MESTSATGQRGIEGLAPDDHDESLIPTAPRTAGPPFNKPSADIVLRTVDNVDFHVWKCLLVDVSQSFAAMLEPAPTTSRTRPLGTPTEQVDGKAVVPVEETSEVLDRLLHTFYPPPHNTSTSLDDLKPVIAAADKYVMDGVLQALKEHLLSFFVNEEPLRVYAIGVQYSYYMQGVTEAAIKAFLTVPEDDANEYVDELDALNASAYRRLLSSRREYLAELKKTLRGLAWLDDGGWTFLHCASCTRGTTAYSLRGNSGQRRYATLWFLSHYQRVGEILEAWPSRKALEDTSICEEALKEASRCLACRDVVHEHMRLFMKTLGAEVDRLVEMVAATIPVPA